MTADRPPSASAGGAEFDRTRAAPAGAARGSPAADLAAVWELLDELPRATASAALAETTVELVAVTAGREREAPAGGAAAGTMRWLRPAAAMLAAFVVGALAGRSAAPDPDRAVLAALPVVRHLDLLREAGSETFLAEVARKAPPRPGRLLLRLGPEALERQTAEFRTELETLRHDLAVAADPDGRAAEMRAAIHAMPLEERVELERAVREFQTLTATERRMLRALAEALADPAQAALRDAALVWHQWLALARPEDRAEVIAGSTGRRLEWLDWYGRIENGRSDRPPRPPEPPDWRGPEGRGGPDGRGPDRRVPPEWRGGLDGPVPRPPRRVPAPLSPDADPPRAETPPAPR